MDRQVEKQTSRERDREKKRNRKEIGKQSEGTHTQENRQSDTSQAWLR